MPTAHAENNYWVYILECGDGSLYAGITTDLERRFGEHARGIGSAYTRSRGARRMIYAESCATRSEASKREAEIKRLPRKRKLALTNRAF